jgi:dihydroflavonol-4-reductase
MTTLVTGAAGFVGYHVSRLLVERQNNVRVLVRSTSSMRAIEGLPCQRVYGDLRYPSSLSEALEGVKQVFHVAADYRLWAKNPDEIYENNVTGTRNLISASSKAGVELFVYTSTVGTIAAPARGPTPNEDTKSAIHEMIGHYKRSKFLAEQEVLNAASRGFPAVIVNPTTPLGPGDWKPTPTGRIVVDFLNGRMPAYIDTGLNVVGVEDVAKGHWLAAQHGRIGQRYILGCRNMTFKELLDALAAVTGRPAPRLRLPYPLALAAGYADNLLCMATGHHPRIPLEGVRMARHKMFVDCSRATRELGFKTGGIEAALERAVRWYIANGYAPAWRSSPHILGRQTL